MDTNQLANKNYWNATYAGKVVEPVQVGSFRHYCNNRILAIKEGLDLDRKTVIEVGGGGSGWLAFLAERYPESKFICIDYSETGCELLFDYARRNDLRNLSVIQDDFLDPSQSVPSADVVYSHGVVEHFPDLAGALSAQGRYLNDSGVMLTIIPNMAGVYGRLTRWLRPDVYDIHVPHDVKSFRRGHEEAGLSVREDGYIGSSNISVVSSCFTRQRGIAWGLYKFATRMNKMIWFVEEMGMPLPRTGTFSPYLYAVSSR